MNSQALFQYSLNDSVLKRSTDECCVLFTLKVNSSDPLHNVCSLGCIGICLILSKIMLNGYVVGGIMSPIMACVCLQTLFTSKASRTKSTGGNS